MKWQESVVLPKMINGFKQFLVEEEKTVYFSFGRMNPPTIGHEKLLDKLASVAGRNPYRMYLSQSNDAKKNPLSYKDKVKYVRKMFPRHARNVLMNTKIKTAMDAAVSLYDEGFRKLVMVVGSDRVPEFEALLTKYNGQEGRHGFYNFMSIKVVSAGERDPDAEGVEGMSASKMRAAAADNDFTLFTQGLPKAFSNANSKALFNAVRLGMGLREAKEFKNHIQLQPVSAIREAYVNQKLFEIDEQVVINKKGIIGKIKHLGTNYLIVESKGETWRCWLDDVSKVDPNQKIHWEDAPYQDPGNDGILREGFTARQKHKLDPNLDLPQQIKHATKQYVDVDVDGDVDAADKMKQAKDFGDVGGVPNLTKYLKKRQDIEKKHTRRGVAFESNQPEWGTPESTRKAKKMTPGETVEAKRNPEDPDIGHRKGSQPVNYHAGLSRAQKIARDRQFKRQAKMSDDNPKAYKPAPGDKTAKTRPSKFTLKYKKMFGEKTDNSHVDIVKQRIKREKMVDKQKHDRMMDRARTRDTQAKNKATK